MRTRIRPPEPSNNSNRKPQMYGTIVTVKKSPECSEAGMTSLVSVTFCTLIKSVFTPHSFSRYPHPPPAENATRPAAPAEDVPILTEGFFQNRVFGEIISFRQTGVRWGGREGGRKVPQPRQRKYGVVTLLGITRLQSGTASKSLGVLKKNKGFLKRFKFKNRKL